MSSLHRHEPELFEGQEHGVCHHSEPFCERCCPNKEHREFFNLLVLLAETPSDYKQCPMCDSRYWRTEPCCPDCGWRS